MQFLIVLALTVCACFALRSPLKACPFAFYALAVTLDVLFLAGAAVALPRELDMALAALMRKCALPLALFVVVMLVGALPKDSKASQWLRPVRAELSIVAWILSLGHMAVYAASYAPRLGAGAAVNGNVMASFALAVVLFALLLVLGVTSFSLVKKRMRADVWKRVQRLAYVFFALAYAHVTIMLLPSAAQGGAAARASVAAYTAVFAAYFALRLWRALRDRKADAGEGADGTALGALPS